MKPILFHNNKVQACIGISDPVSNKVLTNLLDNEKHCETMTSGGGIFGLNINIFTLTNGDMFHSEELNDHRLLVYHSVDDNKYKVKTLKK